MTNADEWPERFEISDPRAILLLSDMRSLEYLSPFMNGAHTLTSAATALRRSPSTLAYWVPKFVRTGLVEQVETRTRAGASMPVYRTPGRQLVVRFADLPFDRRVAFLDAGRMRILRRFLDGLDEVMEDEGLHKMGFSSDRPGGFSVDIVESEADRANRGYTDGWMSLHLTEDDARELAHELEAVFQRYIGRKGPKRFITHRGVAPEPRHAWRSANDPTPD